MSTATEIVVQAFREGNLVPVGAELETADAAEGLLLLNRWLDSLFGFELGELQANWPVPPSATQPVNAQFPLWPQNRELSSDQWPYPPANVRVLLSLEADTDIYLPANPSDGARMLILNVGGTTAFDLTINGNGRLVQGVSEVSGTPDALNGLVLFYRADLGDWQSVTRMIGTDASPLPEFYDDLLAIGTFIRLAPRYGNPVSEELALTFRRLKRRAKAQYAQEAPQLTEKPQPFNNNVMRHRGVTGVPGSEV